MMNNRRSQDIPEVNFEQLKTRALFILARRDHSVRELKNKLKTRLKFQNEDFEKLLIYLEKYNYLAPENKLAERWVKEWRGQGKGRHWISGKLKTKGLPSVNLSDDDGEIEAAKLLMTRKLRGHSLKDLSYQERSKLGRSLISRGFSSSLVATLIHDESI